MHQDTSRVVDSCIRCRQDHFRRDAQYVCEKFRGGKLFELVSYGLLGRQLAWIFQLVFTGKLIEYLPHGQAMPKVTVTPQHLEDFEGGVPCIGFALRRLVCIHTLRLPRASSRMETLG